MKREQRKRKKTFENIKKKMEGEKRKRWKIGGKM